MNSHKKKLCKWSGALSDFVNHIRKKHENSFHIMIKNAISFKWQLPQVRDQEIKGFMSYSAGHIFYKMCYIQSQQSLFFSAYNVQENNNQISFILTLDSKEQPYVTPVCKTLNINSINDSILVTNNIIIHKDALEDFLDIYRYFILKFQIINVN